VFNDVGWAKGKPARLILYLSIVTATFSGWVMGAGNTIITGIIKNASGQPVAGALVKVGSSETGLTFMVVSQAQGRYTTPSLLPGKYSVQGFGGGYQSEAAGPVNVAGDTQAKMDVSLSVPQKEYSATNRLPDAQYAAMMPDGEGKRLLLSHCTLCHGTWKYVTRRKTPKQWEQKVTEMRFNLLQKLQELQHAAAGETPKGALTDHEYEVILDYVAKNFGMDTPLPPSEPSKEVNRLLPRTLLQGAAAKYVAMELKLPGGQQVGAFALDPQGTLWISELTSGIFGRFDPKTMTYSRIFTPPGKVVLPWHDDLFGTVAIDPQGKIWFTSNVIPNAQWFQYDPQSKQILKTFDVPVPTIPGGDVLFNQLQFHSNGSIWATGTAYHRLVKVDAGTGKVTEFTQSPVRWGQHPFGIVIAGDNMIWFAADDDGAVIRVDPDTGKMTPYKINGQKPGARRIETDADGNLWIATQAGRKLVKLDYRTGKMAEYPFPSASAGHDVDVDKKRNLIWFSEADAAKLGRFDPSTNTFVEFSLPEANEVPWMSKLDPTHPNRIWWNTRSGKLGYVEVIE